MEFTQRLTDLVEKELSKNLLQLDFFMQRPKDPQIMK